MSRYKFGVWGVGGFSFWAFSGAVFLGGVLALGRWGFWRGRLCEHFTDLGAFSRGIFWLGRLFCFGGPFFFYVFMFLRRRSGRKGALEGF